MLREPYGFGEDSDVIASRTSNGMWRTHQRKDSMIIIRSAGSINALECNGAKGEGTRRRDNPALDQTACDLVKGNVR